MVLQRNQAIPIWGWAEPGEKITVRFHAQEKNIRTGRDGRWMVRLDAETAGGPYIMTIAGTGQVTFSNVLVGEVWICSGQSNMEMPIAGWGRINHYQQEIQEANYPLLRQFKVPNTVSEVPRDDVRGGAWKVCSPETAGDFTATGYFFARELYRQLQVPIGLINTSWGGTMVETWISRETLAGNDEFRDVVASMSTQDPEAAAKQRTADLLKTITALQGSGGNNEKTDSWKDMTFDDSHWPHMKLPGLWEQQGMGLEELDGVVWFRKTFIVKDEDAGLPAVLELGKIDDSDDSYVNGTLVGGLKNQYNEPRAYHVPAGVLKAGRNVIAVRVEDTGGGGGIYGDAGDMKLNIGGKTISLAGDWSFRVALALTTSSSGPNSAPTLLYNGMIAPLIPYAIRGAIWYQGEANTGRAYQYRKAFPLMISDWRKHWNEGNFPFYFVQLASFDASNGNSEHGSEWAELREAQTMTLSLPNTGMAVTTDIGDAHDIHPKNKQDVGRRLAAVALHNCYGQPVEYSGPVFQSMKVQGNKVMVRFTHTGSGLLAKDRYGYLRGFELAGEDHRFRYAKAYIEGDGIVVYQDSISNPVALRYGWADDAGDANLYNREGFPAGPFRTDNWKGLTEGVKYVLGK